VLTILPLKASFHTRHRSSTAVSLKAREVLILGQMPSYEERLVQMESVLKNSVSDNYYGEKVHGPRYVLQRHLVFPVHIVLELHPRRS